MRHCKQVFPYRTAREPEQRVAHIPPIEAPGPGLQSDSPQLNIEKLFEKFKSSGFIMSLINYAQESFIFSSVSAGGKPGSNGKNNP